MLFKSFKIDIYILTEQYLTTILTHYDKPFMLNDLFSSLGIL